MLLGFYAHLYLLNDTEVVAIGRVSAPISSSSGLKCVFGSGLIYWTIGPVRSRSQSTSTVSKIVKLI